MKNFIYKFILYSLVTPIILMANLECLIPYKCITDYTTIDGVDYPQELRNCRLPNMDTMPINPVDVFESDGTLKTYFGTGETVCDVLGWMNEGAGKFWS